MKRLPAPGALLLAAIALSPLAAAHPPGGPWEGRPGHARAVPAGVEVPTWSELSAEQQEKLAPLRERWDTLPASRRVHALERLERRARWDAMPPEQREKLRRGVRNFHELPPELRVKMRASMDAMRALPEDERRELWLLWRRLDPEQRRAWLEAGGPALSPPPSPPPTQP